MRGNWVFQGLAGFTAVWLIAASASSAAANGSIRGVVSSAGGSEAGVWVIAETNDLDTIFRKIVVTDGEGRFLVPDLPDAGYSVWSRGYGLLDTDKQSARPGDTLKITAEVAPTAKQAAEIYPANYWLSLLRVPDAGKFPGTGAEGNGVGKRLRNQAWWIDTVKDGCENCHQLGNKMTREIPGLDNYESTRHAWTGRLQLDAGSMLEFLDILGPDRAIEHFVDWTDRIRAGEVPEAPPRPDGVERNLVITQWGWSNPTGFIHDNMSTDKRNPALYPYGKIFGVNMTQGKFVITDVVKHQSREFDIPMRVNTSKASSSYGGGGNPSNPHNPMLDDKNRVWMTSTIRPVANPDWCKDSAHPSVKRFPLSQSTRQLSYFDVKTEKFVLIDTCFSTHHLQFSGSGSDMLWLSGDTNVVGWFDTKKYAETRDERVSQGWCPTILDTNGDGKVSGDYVEPEVEVPTFGWANSPVTNPAAYVDPTKDKRVSGFAYGIIPNPADGSVWFTRPYPDKVPGAILRLDPETCLTEQYQPPFETAAVPPSKWGFGPRGIDIDTNGIIWTALGDSGHIASFDRSKCKVLNGPTATGQHCPEGWTLHQTPGPQMKGVDYAGNADYHYFIWVDQFNTLGLGENVPIVNGTSSDALVAWLPEKGEMITLRVPYPLGFYTRGLDGRIDNPTGDWKARGLWASNNTVVPWHIEGGRGMTSEIMHFQIRPHPLAE